MKTLSRFSVVLPKHYDLDAAALAELTKSVTAVLGLGGSGVTMAEKGQLQFVTAVSPDSKELERSQEEHHEGPCRDAYETGEVIRVTDVRQESARWPHYSATATRLGLAGVAGIPMRDGGEVIGALVARSARTSGRAHGAAAQAGQGVGLVHTLERIDAATISPWPRGRVPKRFEHYELNGKFGILFKVGSPSRCRSC